jgi:hypothetical protein
MNVGALIATAFHRARQTYPDLNQKWVRLSHFVGSGLPHSLLSVSIQREGEMDLVLRCMEDETAERHKSKSDDALFVGNYLHVFSANWIGGMYEILRVLKSVKSQNDDVFMQLFYDFELLRIPLEKHQIAKDGDLTAPLRLQRQPSRGDNSDEYVYSKENPKRSHIMPSGITERGSITWLAIDVRNNGSSRWIERRWLSDRTIGLWEAI